MIALSARPVHNPEVLSCALHKGEIVMVNGDSGQSMALTSPTAVLIWELVDGRNNVSAIIDEIKKQFQQVPVTVEDDVLALLEKLAESGFIGFEWNRDDA